MTEHLDSGASVTYSYLANPELIGQAPSDSDMTTTRQYDNLNRLRSVSSQSPAETRPLSFSYRYNSANQRVRMGLADGSFWIYEYDALGQVKSGKRYWSDSTPVAGQQFEYGHDDIGNRKTVKWGGDQSGNLNTTSYGANALNQYTTRTNAGAFNVLGQVNPNAALTINGSSGSIYRRGEYFRRPFSVANSGGPVYTSVTNVATFGGSSETTIGGVYVPKLVEAFSYDLDGNLTGDSLWSYVWDGENRLVEMSMNTGTGISGATRKRLRFDYDWQGRRIRKRVDYHNGSGWTADTGQTRKFVYDGWNLIAELDGSNARVRTYVWGLDMSGTLQGAGGVGGLLMETQHTPSVSHHFAAYDGNGNLVGLVAASGGTYSARYEYAPFGEPIRASGSATIAATNPFRFSTKYTDVESGYLYYGYRYYDPSTGRWPSRDPLNEPGSKLLSARQAEKFHATEEQNPYRFLSNDLLGSTDMLGLAASGTISCDGKGNYKILTLGSPAWLDALCVITHEQQHIDDYKRRYGKNSCKCVPDNHFPIEDDLKEFIRKSECNAHWRQRKEGEALDRRHCIYSGDFGMRARDCPPYDPNRIPYDIQPTMPTGYRFIGSQFSQYDGF